MIQEFFEYKIYCCIKSLVLTKNYSFGIEKNCNMRLILNNFIIGLGLPNSSSLRNLIKLKLNKTINNINFSNFSV